jgi:hypothetical protein
MSMIDLRCYLVMSVVASFTSRAVKVRALVPALLSSFLAKAISIHATS